MSEDAAQRTIRYLSAATFALIAVLIGLDLLFDSRDGVSGVHVALEAGVLIAALVGMVAMLRRFGRVSVDLVTAREDANRWRSEHQSLVRGLSAAIRTQFDAWYLTGAEAEIGLLLLKGLSHQEISQVRETSERTVREQARALYRKSGLSGRNELSAFFLEDLLAPHG
ncbi:helix-turn-helix transcriptional regulator [Marinicauda pacifica]|uniref:helix-turn-helix transcriptional regulator n=1 Tax=Marinicauda pacifica TaxID=1133559 RepID=UPI0035C8580B